MEKCIKTSKMAKQLENKHCRGIISAHFELGADRTIPHTSAQSRTQYILLHFSTNWAILSLLSHTYFFAYFCTVRPLCGAAQAPHSAVECGRVRQSVGGYS